MPTNLNNLVWEPVAAVGTDGKKLLFYYDSHEKRLKEIGLERAPSPQESMSLIIAHLESRLDPELGKVVLNMLERHGEFFCHAAQRSNGNLTIYEYATGFRWNGENYDVPEHLWYKDKRQFNVAGINSGWNDLKFFNRINPELIEYLYSRKYNELPEAIRCSGQIYVPENDKIWPVGRACKPVFGILLDCKNRGSRGVNPKNG